MFSFGGQAPKVDYREAMENRAKVRQTVASFVSLIAVLRFAPFAVEYVKELL